MKSISHKLIFFILFTSVSIILAGAVTIYSIWKISRELNHFVYERAPIIRITQLAAISLKEAEESIAEAMLEGETNNFQDLSEVQAQFNERVLDFDMYIEVLKWGSASEKFKNVQNGLLYSEWRRHGFDKKYIIPAAAQGELAALTGINTHLVKYLEHGKDLFALNRQMEAYGTTPTLAQIDKYHDDRLVLIEAFEEEEGEINSRLNSFIQESDKSTEAEVKQQDQIVRSAFIIVGLIILVHFVFMIMFGTAFITRAVLLPLKKLTAVVNDISKGKLDSHIDQKDLERQDELGELARAFDRTVVSLKLAMQEHVKELSKK